MRRYIPLLLVLALVASACKIRFDTSVTVNDDGSGTLSIEMGADEELRQLSEEDGGLDLVDGTEDFPDDWSVEPFVDGDFEGVRISTDFASLNELNSKLDVLRQTSRGEPAPNDLFSNVEITQSGETFTFRTDTTGLGDDLTLTDGGEGDFGGLDPSAFFESIFEIRLIVTLPGTVTEHNADTAAGSTLTWNVTLADEGMEFFATSTTATAGGVSTAVIAVLAVIIAGGVWLVLSRRNEEDDSAMVADGDLSEDDAPPE